MSLVARQIPNLKDRVRFLAPLPDYRKRGRVAECGALLRHYTSNRIEGSNPSASANMVVVAQLVEPRIVIPVVVGSTPIDHPILNMR